MIGETLRAFSRQDYPDLEIIAVDDRSTDGTAAAIREAAAADPRIRLVEGAETPPGWLGKPWALEQGARAASGELLLFVDADVRYDPAAVSSIAAALEQHRAAVVAVFPRIILGGFWERVAMPQLATAFFGIYPVWLGNRTTWPFLAVGGGPGNLFHRRVYEAIGRHEAIRNAVIDDIGIVRRARKFDFPTVTVSGADLVSIRMYHGLREVVDGFTKNVYYAIGAHVVLASLMIVISAVMQLAPYAGGVSAVIAIAAGRPLSPFHVAMLVALAAVTLGRVILFAGLRYPIAHAIFSLPLMAMVWLWIMIRSTWRAAVRREIVWRGRRHDPRDASVGRD